MQKEKSKVRFIRVRGRVVPIRTKAEKREKRKTSAQLLGASVGVAGGSTLGSKLLAARGKKLAFSGKSSFGLGNLFKSMDNPKNKKRLSRANNLFRSSKGVKRGGVFGSALLATAGLKGFIDKDRSAFGEVAEEAVAVATFAGLSKIGFITAKLLEKRSSTRVVGKFLRQFTENSQAIQDRRNSFIIGNRK